MAESWEDDEEDEEDESSPTPPPALTSTKVQPQFSKDAARSLPNTASISSAPRNVQQGPTSLDAFDFDTYNRTSPAGEGRPARATLDSGKRPEKTTAVANRLIAGALGVRAPRRTDEQRAYDRAIKEQEQRKRDKEKEDRRLEEQRREQAKRSMWDG